MNIHRLLLAAASLAATAAQAHVVLDQRAAPAGSSYKATLRISHGCEGSATTLVRVFVPDSLRGAKPLPKAGWTLAVTRASLAQPYESHGRRVTDDVREITWRGGPLPDAFVDEFSFMTTLPRDPGQIAVRVLQECESGRIEWFETPAPGAKPPRWPAVMLEVQPAERKGHHH